MATWCDVRRVDADRSDLDRHGKRRDIGQAPPACLVDQPLVLSPQAVGLGVESQRLGGAEEGDFEIVLDGTVVGEDCLRVSVRHGPPSSLVVASRTAEHTPRSPFCDTAVTQMRDYILNHLRSKREP
ncbi:MAG: hypothetical protein QOI09_1452 [Chloroflexota bacterium]|nr:hypothetical protein [Chloroflexota bacterium]